MRACGKRMLDDTWTRAEPIKSEDYDRILVDEWPAFFQSYVQDRIEGGIS
jgi:hypothetical protein